MPHHFFGPHHHHHSIVAAPQRLSLPCGAPRRRKQAARSAALHVQRREAASCTNATDGSGATAGGSAGAALHGEDTIEDTVPVKLPQLSDFLLPELVSLRQYAQPGDVVARSAQLPECLRLAPCELTSHCFLIPVAALDTLAVARC